MLVYRHRHNHGGGTCLQVHLDDVTEKKYSSTLLKPEGIIKISGILSIFIRSMYVFLFRERPIITVSPLFSTPRKWFFYLFVQEFECYYPYRPRICPKICHLMLQTRRLYTRPVSRLVVISLKIFSDRFQFCQLCGETKKVLVLPGQP